MNVKFFDLSREYNTHKDKLDNALSQALQEFNLIRGRQVFDFEKAFSQKLRVDHTITTGNGTDAIYASLRIARIGPGDEVITPAFSWISSAETISQCGAKPVFADVDDYFTLDPASVRSRITTRTKAVIAVHIFGQMADVTSLKTICEQSGLILIEDCAQAHLSSIREQYAGSFGQVGCFSFYPTKNLGAYGDAGCIVTHDADMALKLRRFVNHGALMKDDHLIEGINSRMDTLQASVLLAKLPYLDDANRQRQHNAAQYNIRLKDVSQIMLPSVRDGSTHTFHQYVIRAERRNDLQKFLEKNGIQTIIHYPEPLPNLEAYRYLRPGVSPCPQAEQLTAHVLSLPIYPGLTTEEIEYVCEKIKRFYKK